MANSKRKPINNSELEHLLCGKQDCILDSSVFGKFKNKSVLVTGAAGSIGSEISKNLAQLQCKELILLDISESSLFHLQQEFIQMEIKHFTSVIADIRNRIRVSQIFRSHRPDIVIHAAAYKHVPLLESNPNEAVGVNICGTKNIADLSVEYNIDKCILVSTDKAVNPSSVMGATKRIAELYMICLNEISKTKLITARFGNVIDSTGSVIPLFKEQLIKHQNLTLTHKDMSRYFMTISMASQFVLKASSIGNGGEIFVYKMGSPIKIFNLAKLMIELSGLKYPQEIDIKIVGLRPGEKISEALYSEDETIISTSDDNILKVETIPFNGKDRLAKINALCIKNTQYQKNEVVALMKKIIPEYVSINSKFEQFDVNNSIN
jgi:FlaA1/EpsC-like NDP-sugar epimerase